MTKLAQNLSDSSLFESLVVLFHELGQLWLRLPHYYWRKKKAAQERPAISYAGDGAWAMSMVETMTCVRHDIPVTAVVFHNKQWGAEKKNQVDFYDRRFVAGELTDQNFTAIAKSMAQKQLLFKHLKKWVLL